MTLYPFPKFLLAKHHHFHHSLVFFTQLIRPSPTEKWPEAQRLVIRESRTSGVFDCSIHHHQPRTATVDQCKGSASRRDILPNNPEPANITVKL